MNTTELNKLRKQQRTNKPARKPSIKQVKKQVKANNRRVQRANKAFEALSPAEKRVQIARDVLQQLATKRLIAVHGRWLNGVGETNLFTAKDVKANPELQKVLAKQKQCEGCAIGGIFMCAVERHDALKIQDLEACKTDEDNIQYRDEENAGELSIYEREAFRYLRKFFSSEQLDLIEYAFEKGNGARYPGDEAAQSAAYEFGHLFEDDDSQRMQFIMENIVANNGKFDPSKMPVQVWKTPGFVG